MFGIYLSVSKYTLLSIFSALVDWIVFSVLIVFNISPTVSQGLARLAGGLFSFYLNRHWTFRAKTVSKVTKQGTRFLILYLFSYLLGVSGVYIFTEEFDVSVYISKISADFICFCFNFLIMRFYVFKN